MSRFPESHHAAATDRWRRCAVENLEERRLLTAAPTMQLLPGSIAGVVHLDNAVADQRWQPGETGLAGVTMELLDSEQQVLDSTQTDAAGHYQFDGVWPGMYAVRELQPAAMIHGAAEIGSGGGQVAGNTIWDIEVVSGVDLVGYNFSELQPASIAAAFGTLPIPVIVSPAITFPLVNSVPEAGTPRVIDQPLKSENYTPNSVDGEDYAWRLSVLNIPAQDSASEAATMKRLHNASWRTSKLHSGRWLLGDAKREADFGLEGATPLVGDFDGDGRADLALFVDGEWFIDSNGNGRWDNDDLSLRLGTARDQPVVGDWNGDGRDDIGIFGPQQSAPNQAKTRATGAAQHVPVSNAPPSSEGIVRQVEVVSLDQVFQLGAGGDLPIAGDFDGDGRDSIGTFRNGVWRLDLDGDGQLTSADRTVKFGGAGDVPIVGDFDGDGRDEIGIFRNGQWIIDSNHNGEIDAADKVFELGGAGDVPIVGDFNGDGIDEPGLYRGNEPAARISRM